MNINIRVLSSKKCCSRVSLERNENIGKFCARLTELLALIPLRPGGSPRIVSPETIGAFFVGGGLLVVALDKDSHVVGMGRVVFDRGKDSAAARVEDIVVDRWFWRYGIGRNILTCLVELALNHRVRYVAAAVDHGNAIAHAFLDEFEFGNDAGEDGVRRLILNT